MADPILRAMRKSAGLTMGAVARALGVSVTYISDVERGERRLAPKHVEPLAKAIHFPPGIVADVCGYCPACNGTGKARQ